MKTTEEVFSQLEFLIFICLFISFWITTKSCRKNKTHGTNSVFFPGSLLSLIIQLTFLVCFVVSLFVYPYNVTFSTLYDHNYEVYMGESFTWDSVIFHFSKSCKSVEKMRGGKGVSLSHSPKTCYSQRSRKKCYLKLIRNWQVQAFRFYYRYIVFMKMFQL